MSLSDASLLKHIPLFSQLSGEQCSELALLLQPQTYQANQPIFWIGDKGAEFYVVEQGQVVLSYPDEAGNENELAVLGPGNFFGEISLLDGGPRTASARAKTELILLALGREQFLQFLHTKPAAAVHVMTVLGQRTRGMLNMLRGVKNVNEAVEERTTPWQHIADRVAQLVSSPVFLVLQLVLIVVWVAINELQGRAKSFDIYPYCLLALVVSAGALFLSTFVLMSQNRQNQRDRIRADLDYQVNLKAHLEVMELHRKVDRLQSSVTNLTPVASQANGQETGKAEKNAPLVGEGMAPLDSTRSPRVH